LLIVAATLAGWWFRGDAEGVFNQPASFLPEIMQQRTEVRVVPVTVRQGRSADAVVVATGYLESRRQAGIGARAAGRISAVYFEEGNKVTENQLLAELDHADLDAALAAATAAVQRAEAALNEQRVLIEQAASELGRAEKLHRSQSLSDSEYDQVRFAHQTALAREKSLQAELALVQAQELQAEQLRENLFIRAPFAGTVISKDAEAGESIMPGGMGGQSGRGSVATIADLNHLEIEVDVQEDFISRVHEGQATVIAVDAVPTKKYRGEVRKIIPMGDRARATIKVKVEIKDADQLLFPEMAGTVYFLPATTDQTDNQRRLFAPAAAVTRDASGNPFVWYVDDQQRAQKLPVKTGESRDGQIEINAGLTGTERLVVNPEQLRESAPVQIIE
jgi:RND family efflux transporter MFP subunit